VPAGEVLEVAVWEQLTRVPGAPAHVLGVFPLRGEVFPVIDPGILRGDTPEPGHRVVCLRLAGGTLALTAGQLGGVSELESLPAPSEESPVGRCFLGPVELQRHSDVLLVDTRALFEFLSRGTHPGAGS
jgi:purine-binding chemotaxis protein CheW